jgi:hypothetical protein
MQIKRLINHDFFLFEPHLEGVCTLCWPYMDITMAVFHVFPRYKKITKIKFIEIIKKGIHWSKVIIINLQRMKKSNQNCE